MFKKFISVAFVAAMSANAFAEGSSSGSFTTLSASDDATFKGTVDITNNSDNYVLNVYNSYKVLGYPTFYVSREGSVGTTGLSVCAIQPLAPGGAKMHISYSDKLSAFDVNTSSPYNKYYPINFTASGYVFNVAGSGSGIMQIKCPVECSTYFNVASLNADEIKTNDITVDMPNAADYVFEENYNLQPLNEVEDYVKANKHLPGMPSAAEFAQNGMSVSEVSNKLLEKVEELTLHMIQLEKENQNLKAEIENLKK